ncbi:hypothetical protein [Streptomyces sp. NPDC002159]
MTMHSEGTGPYLPRREERRGFRRAAAAGAGHAGLGRRAALQGLAAVAALPVVGAWGTAPAAALTSSAGASPASAPAAADLVPSSLGGLESLGGYPFPVYVSPGGAVRGRAVAERAAKTVKWLERAVALPQTPPLFVVDAEHWDQVAALPIYGMPHVLLDRIVVGQEPAPFWDAVTDAITPNVGAQGLRRLRRVYGKDIDLGPFADLLVSHELTHLAHMGSDWDDSISFWLGELSANLGLHGYVHEVEPREIATLETAFEVTWDAPNEHWPVRDLMSMGDSLDGDGSNYVWFEFGLEVLAKRLWQTRGVAALQRLIGTLRGPALNFDQVVDVLVGLDPWVGQAVCNWPDFPPAPCR